MNRETWLNDLAALMAPRFEELGYPLPTFLVSIGFTSTGAYGRAVGECWDKQTTTDGHFTILITPAEAASLAIAAILNHELIHAAVGIKEGHQGTFAKMMAATGMERPFTQARPGKAFSEWVQPFIDQIGEIPHAPLIVRQTATRKKLIKRDGGGIMPAPVDAPAPGGEGEPNSSAPPKQTTRLLKAACGECGYTVRVTQKWLDVGAPHCPQHGAMEVASGATSGADPDPAETP